MRASMLRPPCLRKTLHCRPRLDIYKYVQIEDGIVLLSVVLNIILCWWGGGGSQLCSPSPPVPESQTCFIYYYYCRLTTSFLSLFTLKWRTLSLPHLLLPQLQVLQSLFMRKRATSNDFKQLSFNCQCGHMKQSHGFILGTEVGQRLQMLNMTQLTLIPLYVATPTVQRELPKYEVRSTISPIYA